MKNLLKRCKDLFKKRNKYLLLILILFLLGLFLRFGYIFPDKIIFGYDQIGDVLIARKIVDYHDLVIQGMNDSSLGFNHGVLLNYFTAILYFLGGGNPMTITYGYAFFNALTVISVFVFAISIFQNLSFALISAFIAAVSFRMILVSGWISNTTVALYLTPFFFLGFWLFKKKHNWGLVLSAFLLGLLIQSQLLMIYNFAVIPVLWLLLKLKRPNLKTILFSTLAFFVATSTMVLTEIRSGFSSINVFLHPSGFLSETSLPIIKRFPIFGKQLLMNFSLNLSPQYLTLGMIAGALILSVIIGSVFYRKTKQEEKNGLILLFVFLLSPIFMLVVGYHDKPWTLIGIVPAIFIAAGYLISKIPLFPIKIFLLGSIFYLNISMVINGYNQGELFINQEPSSTLKGQLAVVDYTYQEAKGEPFAINAVNYPLYYNTFWSYHYPWYGQKKYNYLPNWSGGEQLYPYNSLPASTGNEKVYYMIIDETGAIPQVHKIEGKNWGAKYGKLTEEKLIGGFTVQKFVKR